jgi:hypothetical protein
MAGFGTASSTVGPAPQLPAARIAWTWFMVGLVAWSVSPALRDYSPLAGWLSYWLVGAPLLMLVTIHRQALAARLRSILVGSQPGRGGGAAAAGSRWDRRQGWRRRAPRIAQARRVAPPRRSLVRAITAVFFA